MKYLSIALISVWLSACYSFKGISIPPEINTFFVENFQNRAGNAPAGLEIEFRDELVDKVNNGSKLTIDDTDPHIEFRGDISRFAVEAVAPQRSDDQATTAFNRLTIAVRVNYINNLDKDENWEQSFSFFADFESTTDLSNVQDDLIDIIFTQILEDIFNKAFTNW
jgi:hypothetical protein